MPTPTPNDRREAGPPIRPLEKTGGEKRDGPAPADDAAAPNPSEQRSFESGSRDETSTDKADVQGPAGETDSPER